MKIQIWVRDKQVINGWRQAAEVEGMTLSAWLRRAAERARMDEGQARLRQARRDERALQVRAGVNF